MWRKSNSVRSEAMLNGRDRPGCHDAGFTLVEIVIVMVSIALVVGGVFVGRDLIRQSQLRQVISDIDTYKSAVGIFKDRYDYLPGDMPNATDIWDKALPAPPYYGYDPECYGDSYGGDISLGNTHTCNGNGDGMISGGTYTNHNPHSPNFGLSFPCTNGNYIYALRCDNEQFAVWQQLANAGLDTGIYSPAPGGSVSLGPGNRPFWNFRAPGGNLPSSRNNKNEGFALLHVCGVQRYYLFDTACGHFFFYGAMNPKGVDSNLDDFPVYAVFTRAEAEGIDRKMDDGMPGLGRVMGVTMLKGTKVAQSAYCTDNENPRVAKYANSDPKYKDGPQCALMFNGGF